MAQRLVVGNPNLLSLCTSNLYAPSASGFGIASQATMQTTIKEAGHLCKYKKTRSMRVMKRQSKDEGMSKGKQGGDHKSTVANRVDVYVCVFWGSVME